MTSPSFSGVPVVDGETSISGSPSRLIAPIDAHDSVVTRDWFSFLIDRMDVDAGARELHLGDLADLDAGDADDGAGLQPLHVGEDWSSGRSAPRRSRWRRRRR